MLLYNNSLATAGLMDYDDMLSTTVSLLSLPAVRNYVGQQYAHILVDEFQVGRHAGQLRSVRSFRSISTDLNLQNGVASVTPTTLSNCRNNCCNLSVRLRAKRDFVDWCPRFNQLNQSIDDMDTLAGHFSWQDCFSVDLCMPLVSSHKSFALDRIELPPGTTSASLSPDLSLSVVSTMDSASWKRTLTSRASNTWILIVWINSHSNIS